MSDHFTAGPLPRPGEVSVGDGRINVWSLDLAISDARLGELKPILSQDELVRAERFRFERHRRGFIAARGALRQLLGAYLDVAPGLVRFEYAAKGKPRLSDSAGGDSVHFNVSHSNERALIAVSPVPLGVDIEFLRSLKDPDAIARRFFSDSEQRTLAAVPPDEKLEAFFTCWTRKEAYVKAVGDGLAILLRGFDVTFLKEQAPRLVVHCSGQQAESWFVHHFDPEQHYVGALAVRDRDLTVVTRRVT